MGIDGFSMGNLGINADMTSAQMATQSEQLALRDSEIKVKDVTESAEEDGVKRKEEESEEKNSFEDGFKQKQREDETESENDDEKADDFIAKNFENKNPRDFSLRINYKTELVELYNNKEEQILETINAKDLMGVISKLDSASGVLVNRKI